MFVSDREKQLLRRMKRCVKRTGTRRRRRALKRQLERHPQECEAEEGGFDYGHATSRQWNGAFQDRRRTTKRCRGCDFPEDHEAPAE